MDPAQVELPGNQCHLLLDFKRNNMFRVIHIYQRFHKHANRTLGEGIII
jgi:hypothetical protein